MKVRKNRWCRRAAAKGNSNRNGTLSAQHPQVRRQMQHHKKEIAEALSDRN